MRTAILVFAMMSCSAFARGADPAASSGQASQQPPRAAGVGDHSHDPTQATGNGRGRADRKSSDGHRGGTRISSKSRPTSGISPSRSSHPEPRSITGVRSAPENAFHLQPGAAQSDRAATGGLIHNETAGRVAAIRPPIGTHPAAPSLSEVRHRGPNPAIVGGSSDSKMRTAGSINGTRINRRP